MERRPLGNVLVATDFTRHGHEAVARAMWLPVSQGSGITLLHVVPPGAPDALATRVIDSARELMARADALAAAEAARAGLSQIDRFVVVEAGRPDERIVERARQGRAELVVVGRGERHGVRERLLGSTAERVVRASEPSVLVVTGTPTGPYRRPLLAVDLSEVSPRVVEWAVRLSDASVRALPVVHSYGAPYLPMLREGGMAPPDLDRSMAELEHHAAARFDAWLESMRHVSVPLERAFTLGDPRQLILDEAERRRADLIVIGSRRHSRIGGLLVGSVAESIARHAACDLLLVR